MSYYGRFGLINYNKTTRKLLESEILGFGDCDPVNITGADMLAAHKKSLWSVYLSLWRITSRPILDQIAKASIEPIGEVKCRVQALYIDQLFPHYYELPEQWLEKYRAIKVILRCKVEWEKIGTLVRSGGVRLVICHRPGKLLTDADIEVLNTIWLALGFPEKSGDYSLSFRLFLHTSNIHGAAASQKLVTLEKWKKYTRHLFKRICLIADDLATIRACAIAQRTGIRVALTSIERDENSKRISTTSPQYTKMSLTWREHEGSSGMKPVVFVNEQADANNLEKLVTHYAKSADVVLY